MKITTELRLQISKFKLIYFGPLFGVDVEDDEDDDEADDALRFGCFVATELDAAAVWDAINADAFSVVN